MFWSKPPPRQEENNQPLHEHEGIWPEAGKHIEAILDQMPAVFCHLDMDFCITYVNRRAELYAGRSQEEILGQSLWEVVPELLVTFFEQQVRTAMEERQEVEFEMVDPRQHRWVKVSAYPTCDGLCIYFHDIHQRRQAEEALRESEQRFRRFVDSNLLGIMVTDPQGIVREANDAFLELLGYTREDLAMGRIQLLALSPPEYQKQVAKSKEELFATGTTGVVEKEFVRKDGTRVPVEVGGTLLSREGSEPSILGFMLDLTANKEMERQKDLMLSMTSHELKTPLAALSGTLQLIRRRMQRVVSAEEHLSQAMSTFFAGLTKSVEDGLRQIDVQTNLINDLLDASRITAGTLKLEMRPCDLVPLVRETTEDVRVTAPERSLVLEEPEHCTMMVLADRARISQVVTNYLTNAIRYSPPDRPVHIGLDGPGNSARVWVRDQGPGLTEEAQAHLWQRFSQIKGIHVQSGSGKGLGLGLYICQTLIAEHQGEVGVESEPGKGSTFWFTLPLIAH